MQIRKVGGNITKFRNIFISTALLVIAIAIGLGGYYVSSGKARLNEYPNPFKKSETEIFNCGQDLIKKTGVQNNYCLTNSSENFDALLIGDSNADHLFIGLATNSNIKLMSLGQGGCAPLFNVNTHFFIEGDQHCQDTIAPALKFAIRSPEIKTIIISMAGQGLINSKRNLYGDKMRLQSTIENTQEDINGIFEDSLLKTLDQLIKAKKRIIFIMPIPRLDFHPHDCADVRPLKLKNKKLIPICAVTKKLYEEDSDPYLRIALKVLKRFPQVLIFNPAIELCDNQYCYAVKNGEILYRDELHLSAAGSKLIGKKIIQLYENID